MPATRMKKKIKLRETDRDTQRERERGETDLKRGSLNWILGKQLGIYYCTFFFFFVILSQANRSKAAQREKAG